MIIGLLGLLIGLILGLSFAIWIVTVAGYDWQEIMRRWHIQIVYLRYKAEIDAEIEDLTGG